LKDKIREEPVYVQNKTGLLSYLESTLSDLEVFIEYDYDYLEDEDVILRIEMVKALGRIEGILISLECDPDICKVEAPEYEKAIAPCETSSDLGKLKECVDSTLGWVKRYRENVSKLQEMGDKLRDWYWLDKHRHGLRAVRIETLELESVRVEVELVPWKGFIRLDAEGTPEAMVKLAKLISGAVRRFTKQTDTPREGENRDATE
jgi:hypothetical protein